MKKKRHFKCVVTREGKFKGFISHSNKVKLKEQARHYNTVGNIFSQLVGEPWNEERYKSIKKE